MSADLRPPVVTDADRQWAVWQKPDWPATYSAEQAERFERHFADERKTAAEWSGLWRRSWWPKTKPNMLKSSHVKAAPGVNETPRPELRPPVVTDRDRQWARDLKPAHWDRDVIERWTKTYPHLAAKVVPSTDYDEIVDDGAMLESGDWNLPHMPRPLAWGQHVEEQAEAFEAHFAIDRKTWASWSSMWRLVWWPKADPAIRHPRSAPVVPCVMVRASDTAWPDILAKLKPDELKLAMKLGCMPFKRSDPRAASIGGNS